MWGSPIEIIRDTRLKRRLSISTQVSDHCILTHSVLMGGIWRQMPLIGRVKGRHPWVATHVCGVTSTVTTRRLRKTHSPDLVGRRLKSKALQGEQFYVCSSARRFDSRVA